MGFHRGELGERKNLGTEREEIAAKKERTESETEGEGCEEFWEERREKLRLNEEKPD